MTAPRIDEQLLRRLRDEAADDGPVVSVYLSLDPTTFSTPEARESQLRSLLNEARRADPRARDIARRIQQELAPGWPADGAHGIPRGPRSATKDNPLRLTMREVEILSLLAENLSNKEIAAKLRISPKTVDHHIAAVLAKLGVATRKEAAKHPLTGGALLADRMAVAIDQ